MSINKEKSINYIASAVVFFIALFIINKVAFHFWQFDIFSLTHYKYFGKFIVSGRILKSPKYLSFLSVILGACLVTYFSVVESFKFDFNKYFKKNEKPEEVPVKEEVKEESVSKEEVKEEISPVKAIEDEKIARYSVYNNPEHIKDAEVVRETLKPENEIKEEVKVTSEIDEDKEREKLQSKIREVMERLKNKTPDEKEEVEEPAKKTEKKILTPVQFDEVKSDVEMNFKTITPEQNSVMEETLVSAGFKLLSEIRIGKTGIDYLGVSKSGISIIQLDTKEGNWMASEDNVGGVMPVWFSEDKQKYSPVARAIEARNAVSELIKGKVDLPVKAFACLANSSVMNYFDIQDEWKDNNVEVLRLSSNKTIDDIDIFEEKFAPSSEEEIDEPTMNTLIEILEKAELPE
ncbi:MAG: hypothetical protein ACI4N3_03990 [Alphaproteobacteria bacterium]